MKPITNYRVGRKPDLAKSLLIIFIKNPVKGKVKRRLAKKIGDEAALSVYRKLLEHTRKITKNLEIPKAVFYANYVPSLEEHWTSFKAFLQVGNDIGERMSNAFQKAFELGFENVVLIGGDIVELNENIVRSSFEKLENHEVVLGPAKDGGYYLIGMKKNHDFLFDGISWGSSQVFYETIELLKQSSVSFAKLNILSDLDTYEDFLKFKEKFRKDI